MVYTEMTKAAMRLAYNAHHGQVDKGGMPYIFHPIHLAEQMEEEITCTVALLHDVVEDTDITMAELRELFPKEVTDALTLLTHRTGTDYFDYVRAIGSNPVAKAVKLADLAHNSDQSRCTGISEEKMRQLRVKYEKATKILTEI